MSSFLQGSGQMKVLTVFKRLRRFSLPVLLIMLESFAGVKPAARRTGEL